MKKILVKEYKGLELLEKNDGWGDYWEIWKGNAILESFNNKQKALNRYVALVSPINA